MLKTVQILCLVFSLLIYKSSYSKKLNPANFDLSSSKLNECQRCKVLTDSFNHWIEKTSRGNFAGGDTAWEEAKLKSYARSEVRLVEVQEGLCSELKKHQDQCYSIAEEAEQTLETWWFHEDPNSDLHSWLCIERLQYCCPQMHYGENCEPCPVNKNNQVCSRNGICDGEGTRKGNGSCKCHKGYVGKNCEACDKNFYAQEDTCKVCHKSCDGCKGSGADACVACKPGWRLESGKCVDVNECDNPNVCKPNQFCANSKGSFMCLECDKPCQTCAGAGRSNCTSCEDNLLLWSGRCIDESLKNELLNDAIRRAALYFGLFVALCIVSRYSLVIASVIVMAMASYIYLSEKTSMMTLVERWRDELDSFSKDWPVEALDRKLWKKKREAFAQQWDILG